MSKQVRWLQYFYLGWTRRSAIMLDNCGLPLWFIRWRCPTITGWGSILRENEYE
jgi:hypothetical protein